MNANNKKEEQLKKNVIEILAEYLGVETKDIFEEDSLTDDLHMEPANISEFISVLEEKGVETGGIDLKEVDTVSDLLESIVLSQPL